VKLPGVRRIVAPIALVGLLLLIWTPGAHAFIYWADTQNQTIGRAENDGSGVNDSFIHTGQLPYGVAVDASHIYWANQNSNSIGRANINGTGADNSFITGITSPSGVAVNGSSVYWSTLGGKIGHADLNGSNKNLNFITGPVESCGLALDSGHVYWVDIDTGSAYIGRAGLDGFNVQLSYVTIPGTSFPCGVAVNTANIFWADTGFFGGGTRIGRANTNTGGGADPSVIGDAATPCGVALDTSSHLYWANAGTNTIARANTDTTGVNESFVPTGGNGICGVAVDNLSSPPPSPTPASPTIRFGTLKRNQRQGVVTLPVTPSGPGTLTLTGKGIIKRQTQNSGGTSKLIVKAKGRLLRRLRRKGTARVTVKVTFTPLSGAPVSQSRKIVLREKQPS